MSGTHELTLEIDTSDGEARIVLLCHAVSDAPCRRRPPDWEQRGEESWNDDEATVGGFECWAVEYISEGGLECLSYDGPRKTPFTYAGPVDVWYDEGVAWCEAAQDEPLPIAVS